MQHFIDHERRDYSARAVAGRRGISQPWTLLQTNSAGIKYQVYILGPLFAHGRHLPPIVPKQWHRHPVPAIMKGREGMMCHRQM